MIKHTATRSALLACLLAAAGFAQAQIYPGGPLIKPMYDKNAVRQDAKNQDRASATSNVPNRAGEASTVTNGNPNAMTSNPAASEFREPSAQAIRNEAKNQDKATATSGVAPRAGEASAYVNGVPNMDPAAPINGRSSFASRRSNPNATLGFGTMPAPVLQDPNE